MAILGTYVEVCTCIYVGSYLQTFTRTTETYTKGHEHTKKTPSLTFVSGVIPNDSMIGEVHCLALIGARLEGEFRVLDVEPSEGAGQ